jgi:hypothetical protein
MFMRWKKLRNFRKSRRQEYHTCWNAQDSAWQRHFVAFMFLNIAGIVVYMNMVPVVDKQWTALLRTRFVIFCYSKYVKQSTAFTKNIYIWSMFNICPTFTFNIKFCENKNNHECVGEGGGCWNVRVCRVRFIVSQLCN